MPPPVRLVRAAALAAALAGAAGCADLPDFGPAEARFGARPLPPGAYPAILPREELLAAAAGGRIDPALLAALAARAAALRARAAALRRPVIEAPTRARMTAALGR